jgi:hypothetical protein
MLPSPAHGDSHRECARETGIRGRDLSALPTCEATDKQRILDEFCAVTGYHRKAAIRVLTGPAPGAARPARLRPLIYPPPVIEALRDIWVAAGRRGARQGLAQVEADVAAVERALHLLG